MGKLKGYKEMIRKLEWGVLTKDISDIRDFSIGNFYFNFTIKKEHLKRFIAFLKEFETEETFPIYPSELVSFLKKESIEYSIKYVYIKEWNLYKNIRGFLNYRKVLKTLQNIN